MLEFNTAFEKDILVIELEGSLDSHSAADFRSWFNEKTRGGYRAFAIDCLCLEYISSAGISALIDLQNALAGQNGKMVLYQLSSETRQLLKFLQLEKKLNLAGDYDDAIAALTGIKKIIKEEAPPIVDAGEIRVLPKAPEPEPAPQPEVATKPASDEMQELHDGLKSITTELPVLEERYQRLLQHFSARWRRWAGGARPQPRRAVWLRHERATAPSRAQSLQGDERDPPSHLSASRSPGPARHCPL